MKLSFIDGKELIMQSDCNKCEFLEFNRSPSYNSEILFGGATYSCKKNYFTFQTYPYQPQECVDGKSPRNRFSDIKFHEVTDEELQKMHEETEMIHNIFNKNK